MLGFHEISEELQPEEFDEIRARLRDCVINGIDIISITKTGAETKFSLG